MSLLKIVITSTRPGRAGLPIGTWFVERARAHAGFEIEVVDLAEINLPFIDEREHPRFKRYEHEHTQKWSRSVEAADAFVFVVPEYDYGMPATLLNALHLLFSEWHYKAVGFVSYGGISGGVRSVQMSKQVITSLKMMPLPEAVTIPFFNKQMENGVYKGEKMQEDASKVMLDELVRWTNALKTMRS
jgi:NAD(P)H-dependent FMN reductase